MPNMVVVGSDGETRPSREFEAIATASRDPGATAELHELARAIEMMKETLSNPEIAQSIHDMQSGDFEPQPEIFEAIEDCDIEAVRAALTTWEINRTFGEYESTALYHAMSCSSGFSLEVINLLLDSGADPNKGLTDTNVLHGLGFARLQGVSPDDLAAVVRRCVDLGADIEQRSNTLRWTPLITAASEWNPVATEALLLAGADITARSGEVEGVCYSGSDCLAFAEGDEETVAVIKRFLTPN